MHSPAVVPLCPLSRVHARVFLALFAAGATLLVAVTFSPLRSGFADAPDRGPGDVALYQAEVDRIRAGASYYDAAAAELPERGYPTHSVFNWRTPLPVWLVARLPADGFGNAILGALGMLLMLLSLAWLADEAGPKQAMLGGLLLTGALLPCLLGDLMLMSELWSGVLVALSAALYATNRRGWAVTAGVAALFFRELAAPYCLVCLALALHGRQWRELARWCWGLVAYAAFYAVHLSAVLPHLAGAPKADVGHWLQFGGPGFLISTAQMNAYLLLLPQWITAIYLACALASAATWNSPAGQRVGLTIAAYAVAFSIVGNDFNQYWGSQIAPLLCLAVARLPSVLQAAVRAAWPSRGVLGHTQPTG